MNQRHRLCKRIILVCASLPCSLSLFLANPFCDLFSFYPKVTGNCVSSPPPNDFSSNSTLERCCSVFCIADGKWLKEFFEEELARLAKEQGLPHKLRVPQLKAELVLLGVSFSKSARRPALVELLESARNLPHSAGGVQDEDDEDDNDDADNLVPGVALLKPRKKAGLTFGREGHLGHLIIA